MIEIFLKVVFIGALLRYLRVFDVQSILMFILSSFLLFFVFGAQNVPEMIIFCTMAVFFAHITASALLENTKRIEFKMIKLSFAGRYFDFFCAMCVVLFFMIQVFELAGFENRAFLYVLSFVFYMVLVFLKESIGAYVKGVSFLSYRSAFFVIVLYCLAFLKYGLVVQMIFSGVVYVVVFMLYAVLYNSFTADVGVEDIASGMVLAENIVRKGRKYVKSRAIFFTPLSVFRNNLMQKMRGECVVFGSFKPLSEGDVRVIEKIMRTYKIPVIKVQRTVDMRIYLVLGILFVAAALISDWGAPLRLF